LDFTLVLRHNWVCRPDVLHNALDGACQRLRNESCSCESCFPQNFFFTQCWTSYPSKNQEDPFKWDSCECKRKSFSSCLLLTLEVCISRMRAIHRIMTRTIHRGPKGHNQIFLPMQTQTIRSIDKKGRKKCSMERAVPIIKSRLIIPGALSLVGLRRPLVHGDHGQQTLHDRGYCLSSILSPVGSNVACCTVGGAPHESSQTKRRNVVHESPNEFLGISSCKMPCLIRPEKAALAPLRAKRLPRPLQHGVEGKGKGRGELMIDPIFYFIPAVSK
jgi:hypothetical protein